MHIILSALAAWAIAQGLKIVIGFAKTKKWDWRLLTASGGMPSSHTALVVATSCRVGMLEGFESTAFAVCVVLSMIVMYDAAGVRRETGTQATVINQILKDMLLNGKKISDEELKELVGHTPLEVAGGALTGLLVAVIYLLILFA